MKQNELQKCATCGKGVMHNNDLQFFRLTIEPHIINVGAVQRQHGLEMHMGGGINGAALASIMGPNEDIAQRVTSRKIFICQSCAIGMTDPAPRLCDVLFQEDDSEDTTEPNTA